MGEGLNPNFAIIGTANSGESAGVSHLKAPSGAGGGGGGRISRPGSAYNQVLNCGPPPPPPRSKEEVLKVFEPKLVERIRLDFNLN